MLVCLSVARLVTRGFVLCIVSKLTCVANYQKNRREFDAHGIQVHVVDYHNKEALRFALNGIDLVISTISGQEQLNLINAAAHGRVRYFVPSEFEGCLSKRPPGRSDPLDRGSAAALTLLGQWTETSATRLKWTVFSCGIFMERFHPYGLSASLGIGAGEGVGEVGSYVADINQAIADYTPRDGRNNSVKICLTSVLDVVRFVIAAIDLGPATWPTEFTMRGDRKSLREVVDALSTARNGELFFYGGQCFFFSTFGLILFSSISSHCALIPGIADTYCL